MFLDTDLLIRNNVIETAELEEELGMLNIETGKYYLLNSIASDIWSILKYQTTYFELINKLLAIYDVGRDQCILETNIFLSEMISNGLISRAESI